jgi:diaminopimelate decarboxylase
MFGYVENTFCCEDVPLADIAKAAGTPVYVYSSGIILNNYRAYDEAFEPLDHTVCYAVKANSTLGILSLLAEAGSGFDIVSAGELFRVLQVGGDPKKVVFSGVGKTASEVEYALCKGIHSFNCESEAELALIDALAGRLGIKADFAVRVNPDVNAATHPYIATGLRDHKFGVDISEVEAVYDRARSLRNLVASGVSCHIGSQLLDTDPTMEAADKMLALIERLRASGHAIRYVDLGGGLGVAYNSAQATPEIREFIGKLRQKVEGRGLAVMVEPGRSIVGAAGVLLTRVLYRKTTPNKEFVVVDAAMNDLIRPALYQSHHEILPLRKSGRAPILADVVGPVCETGDFLARDRQVADAAPGDMLAVCTAGAYGFALSSNYNSRPRPPEILVSGGRWRTIRTRETLEDLIRGEQP